MCSSIHCSCLQVKDCPVLCLIRREVLAQGLLSARSAAYCRVTQADNVPTVAGDCRRITLGRICAEAALDMIVLKPLQA